MMKERTRSILEISVRDFIKCGRPITSEYLYEIHDFGIKPAMIRWELNSLSEDGYFFQNHPSGGRFPTDKAYRFFVEELLSDDMVPKREKEESFSEEIAAHGTKSFIHDVAEYLNVLSVGYDTRNRFMYGSGLPELLEHLEADSKEELVGVVDDFESLEERLLEKRDWWERHALWPQVFIGESPVTKSGHLSVIAGKFDCNGSEVLLLSIGPKRMDYQKSVRLFKSLGKPKQKKKRESHA